MPLAPATACQTGGTRRLQQVQTSGWVFWKISTQGLRLHNILHISTVRYHRLSVYDFSSVAGNKIEFSNPEKLNFRLWPMQQEDAGSLPTLFVDVLVGRTGFSSNALMAVNKQCARWTVLISWGGLGRQCVLSAGWTDASDTKMMLTSTVHAGRLLS